MNRTMTQAGALFLEGFYQSRADYGNVPANEIRSAGRPTKVNPRGEDELWWLTNGPQMVQRWIDWRQASGWEIWTAPDGRPGIELELMPVFGEVPVKMIIDRVFTIPETRVPVVVDLKSGKRTPASDLQLAFYAAGIKAEFGISIEHGAYWMARTGELTPVQSIARYTVPLLTHWVRQFAFARSSGIYLPNITELCRACGVNRYCYAFGGSKSDRDSDAEHAIDFPF